MRMIFGAISGIKCGRGNRSTRRKPTPAPLCPPQNPTLQTRSRTPDRSGGKPATNRQSYGATFLVPFRRLLRHARSRWRYSTPPPHGLNYCIKVRLCLSVYLSAVSTKKVQNEFRLNLVPGFYTKSWMANLILFHKVKGKIVPVLK
jgi:hypothetical protein